MNTFNKKSLYAAFAGVSALGMAGTADAVHVNPDGLGQVLIYPYYTVRTRGGTVFTNPQFNSLLSVVNSSASAKAVKVRFLEGKASKEVLDFNLYRSAHDVWTAGVIPTADGAGIVTVDKSCTVRRSRATWRARRRSSTSCIPRADPDDADSSLDRTREGYVEIIEMGDVTGPTALAATHVAGVPPCTAAALTSPVAPTNTVLGSGGLFGSMTIINVNSSAETGYDPVALEAFRTVAPAIWADAGSILPDLTQQLDTTITGHQAETYANGLAVVSGWTSGINAVSASLMHDNVMNEYVLDTGTASLTDWVVTYPTKRYYVSAGTGAASGGLFQRNFSAVGACDDVTIAFWDREEQVKGGPPPGFSPPGPGSPVSALCWEANVVTFNNSNLFASTNSKNINVAPFQDGWGRVNLVGGATAPIHQLVSTTNQTFNGLPVVGFATSTYFNGGVPLPSVNPGPALTLQSAYGASFKHKTTTLIQ
jgi:hypothetical protein